MTEDGLGASLDSGTAGRDRFRYERKFAVTEMARAELELILRLNPAAFSEIYFQRWVNNIYFDTLDGDSLWDNLSGASQERAKVRIRWYGSFDGTIERPVLEIKVKRGMVNRKTLYPLNAFRMDARLGIHTLRELIRNAGVQGGLMHNLMNLELALANRYQRSYFLSADRKFRTTIDSELQFHGLNAVGGTFPGRWIGGRDQILELKYDESDDRQADSVTEHLPFRVTRSSKFVSGVELTRRHLGYF